MDHLMSEEKLLSERVIPMVSDEEMVVVEAGGQRMLAKMMDLSESGTFVYLLGDSPERLSSDDPATLSLYHQGKVFAVRATVARISGRLVAFRFHGVDSEASNDLQTKLIRMEVEWMRLQRLI